MSWRRDHDSEENAWRNLGGPGGDWRGLRPSFDNPMTWAVRLARISGITVRVHVIFLAYIAVVVLRAVFTSDSPLGPEVTVLWLVGLFAIVLAHEFGHCLACRWSGGNADEILMWPLGGLAYCRPENRWKSHLVTVIGGPAVNVIICVVAGVMLGLATGHWLGVALPNPLSVDAIFRYDLDRSWGLLALFLLHWTSLLLLLFNLLPVFPLDGGRMLQALLWAKIGYVRSMRIAVRVGYVGAIALGLFGAVIEEWLLLGIAIFGGITCYLTHKQMQYTESVMSPDGEGWIPDLDPDDEDGDGDARDRRSERRDVRRRQREDREAQQVDGILEKIAESGMDSLTGRERRLLQRVTERKRDEG